MVSAAVNGSHQATVSMDKQYKPENNYLSEVTYYQINEQYYRSLENSFSAGRK